ncbi:MAG: ribonuclease III [Proteobacteria bacterium]|nr:MAG: ribonuclease III [Pseudomonadota bacterium]
MSSDRHAIEAALEHAFADPALLQEALTHASFRNEREDIGCDYERLEFLGDAVFELAVSQLLFRRLPQASEGHLTQLRARLVNAKTLAGIARRLDLGAHIQMGRGEQMSGGRDRDSILADVLEAIVGAVYLDGGLDAAVAVVAKLTGPALTEALARDTLKDAKSRLQEWAQGHHQITPRYLLEARSGPPHDAWYEASVQVGDLMTRAGQGRSKKAAEQAAAAAALQALTSAHAGRGHQEEQE